MAQQGKLRVIAGKWRGTKIAVEDVKELRPTPNRIRETLFNWLQQEIINADCLDLFAGSGALTFEAASREAKRIDCVEINQQLYSLLQGLRKNLQAEELIHLHNNDAMQWLEKCNSNYDLIFLDPPFNKNLILPLLEVIENKDLLKPGGKVYIEIEKKLDIKNELSGTWQILKQTHAGEVQAYLLALSKQ